METRKTRQEIEDKGRYTTAYRHELIYKANEMGIIGKDGPIDYQLTASIYDIVTCRLNYNKDDYDQRIYCCWGCLHLYVIGYSKWIDIGVIMQRDRYNGYTKRF
jgi:hypothetical protein